MDELTLAGTLGLGEGADAALFLMGEEFEKKKKTYPRSSRETADADEALGCSWIREKILKTSTSRNVSGFVRKQRR